MSDDTPTVFISYASQDAAVAGVVVGALEAGGIRCWIAPRDVLPGEFYADAIVRALNESRILVLLMTADAIASPHVLREVERTSAKRHAIVTVRLTDAPLPPTFEYFLSASHWLDASAMGIDAAMPRLIQALGRLSAPPSGTAPVISVGDAFPLPLAARQGQRLGRLVIALGAVVFAVIAYLLVDKFWLARPAARERPAAAAVTAATDPAPAISEKSLAVLAFVDMSEKHDQEYFSDGLSEELIDMLTHVQDLRVAARTSSFYFKGRPDDIPSIAKRLKVAHILEGSVRKSGNHLRITAQLIRAETGYHLWSETYDRELNDIFKVQDEIAGAVVKALQVPLAHDTRAKSGPPANPRAYTLYLQGRAINHNANDVSGYERAADYMRRAVSVDPGFAEAWAWLSIVLGNEIFEGIPRAKVAPELRRASERALELAPDLAKSHSARAAAYWFVDWDWAAGVAEYQQAYDLDPGDANNAKVLGDTLFILRGPSSTVLSLFRKAIALDPANPECFVSLGNYYFFLGELSEAEAALRRAIDLASPGASAHFTLGSVLLARGKAADARVEFRRDSDETDQRLGEILTAVALGQLSAADAGLSVMKRKDAATGAYGVAQAYAYRGQVDEALTWLERANRQREGGIPTMTRDPLLHNLHGDARWHDLRRRLKLPE